MTNMSLQAANPAAAFVGVISPDPPASPIVEEVVRRLQRVRRENGYTLQEVYDMTGIHVARLETRKANLTIATLATLCQYYKISLAEFFQGL